MNTQREYFGYHRLFRSIRRSLPPEKQPTFIEAIEDFGFNQVLPDFSNDQQLAEAWAEVLPTLTKGWEQHDKGAIGGKSKAKPAPQPSATPAPQERPPMPPAGAPEAVVVNWLKSNGWRWISEGAGAINREQIDYLLSWYGHYTTGFVLAEVERLADTRGAGVFDEAITRLEALKAAFLMWHDKEFPALGKRDPAKKLTLEQFLRLRAEYGRYNVIKKLCDLERKPIQYPNAAEEKTLTSWLKVSFDSPPSSYKHMEYNDSGIYEAPKTKRHEAKLFAAGWDIPFDIDPHQVKIISTKTNPFTTIKPRK